jgi:hypothetical protein
MDIETITIEARKQYSVATLYMIERENLDRVRLIQINKLSCHADSAFEDIMY